MPGRKTLLWWTSSLPRRLSQVTLVFLNVGFPMAQFSIFWSFNVINKYLCTSEMERSARMTWIDFFSSLGGLSGLCLFLLLFTSMFHWVYFRWPLWTLSWVQCHILHWGFDSILGKTWPTESYPTTPSSYILFHLSSFSRWSTGLLWKPPEVS